MKLIRLFLRLLGVLAVLLVIFVAVVLLPAVQTWVAQAELARQPGFKGTLGLLTAGFGEADVTDLRLEFKGAVLTAPSVKVKLPVTNAVWRRRLLVRSLVAKGWTLDLSRRPAEKAEDTGSASPAGPAGSGPAQGARRAAAAAAARAFAGIVSTLRLPVDGTYDGIVLEGDVLVPLPRGKAPASVHVVLKGGGVAPGRDGTLSVDANSDLSDSGFTWDSLSAHGSVDVAIEPSLAVGRIGIKADISARSGSREEAFALSAEGAPQGAAEEVYSLDLVRGGRHLLRVAARTAATGSLSGTWQIDLLDSDLGRLGMEQRMPGFAAAGAGSFETDASLSALHVRGSVAGVANRLGVLAPPLGALGAVHYDSGFELTGTGRSLRIERLGVSFGEAMPAAVVQLLQPFEVDPGNGALTPADPASDWLEITVRRLPLAWLSGIFPRVTLTGGDATGDFIVRGSKGGFFVRAKKPVRAAGVVIQGAGAVLARGLDLSVMPQAEFSQSQWKLQLSPLSADCEGRRLVTIDATATGGPAANGAIAANGTWSADLEALAQKHAAPAYAWISGRSASGDFSLKLGSSSEFEAKGTAVGLDPKRTVTASAHATIDSDGSVSFLVPVRITVGPSVTEVSAEGTWDGTSAGAGGSVNLTGGTVSLDHLRLLAGPLAALGGVLSPGSGTSRVEATSAPPSRDTAPFWGNWAGRVAFAFDALKMGDREFSDVGGTLDFDQGSVRLEGGRGGIDHHLLTKVEGSISFNSGADTPYTVVATTAAASEVEAGALFSAPASGQSPLVEGRFSVAGAISGKGRTLADLIANSVAEFRLKSTTGIIRLLQTSVADSIPEASTPVKDALGSVGSAVGGIFGHRSDPMGSGANVLSKNAEAVLSLTNEVAEIGCDQIAVDALREAGGTVRILSIEVTARDEHIKGTGQITYVRGEPLFKEPLSVDLQLGARGRVAELLTKAGLLSSRKDDLGYATLSQPIQIRGTLGHLDMDQWHDLLAKAAARKPEEKK